MLRGMITNKMKVGEMHNYTTHKQHGSHAAGTKCLASRNKNGELILDFGKGKVVVLTTNHFAAGIEDAIPADAVLYLAM